VTGTEMTMVAMPRSGGSLVAALRYIRYDLVKVVRNRRFFIFSLGFPLILYVVVAGTNHHAQLGGIPLKVYYLTGMASWGSMNAVTSGGGLIALERSAGWTRQLRVTPLPVWAYMTSKVVRGYASACVAIIVLYIAAIALNAHLQIGGWLIMTGLILVGLLPFAALGIMLGHTLSPDSLGPALGGISALFALLGGAWGPIAGNSGAFLDVVKVLPSYWLVRAGEAGLTQAGWPLEGWAVIGAWAALLTWLALVVYRRDTGKT
jgi:ABC-2 type transport system permease protein